MAQIRASEMEEGRTYFLQPVLFSRIDSPDEKEAVVVHHRARVLEDSPTHLDFVPISRTREGVEVLERYKDSVLKSAYKRSPGPFFSVTFVLGEKPEGEDDVSGC